MATQQVAEFEVPKTLEIRRALDTTGMPEQASRVLDMISQIVSDPNASMDKLERIIGLQEKIIAQNAKAAYDTAFAEMQPELPEIQEKGKIVVNGEVRSRYALFEDINKAIIPILAKHGFALSHRRDDADGAIRVTTILSHRCGHREQTSFNAPADTSGSKNNVQAIKSTMSYAERINVCALLNLSTRGADDDGQAAGGISDEQIEQINKLLEPLNSEQRKRFLGFMQVQSLPQIKPQDFQKAINALESIPKGKPERKSESPEDGKAFYAHHHPESHTYSITGSQTMCKAYASVLKPLWDANVRGYVATPEQYGKLISQLEKLKVPIREK